MTVVVLMDFGRADGWTVGRQQTLLMRCAAAARCKIRCGECTQLLSVVYSCGSATVAN